MQFHTPYGDSTILVQRHHAVLACAVQDGLAEGDGLEVVAAGDVGLGAGLEGAEQAGHRAGEGVGEPGLGPARAVPGAAVVGSVE